MVTVMKEKTLGLSYEAKLSIFELFTAYGSRLSIRLHGKCAVIRLIDNSTVQSKIVDYECKNYSEIYLQKMVKI